MRKLLLPLLLCTLAFAGCGDDKKTNTSTTDTTAAGADSGTDTTSAEDATFSGKGSKDFCALAKKLSDDLNDQANAETPAQIKKQFTEIEDAIGKLEKEAPGEIQADVKVVQKAFKETNDVYDKYDYDASKIPPAEAEKLSINDPAIAESSARVEAYFSKVCGIDNGTDSTSTTLG